MADTTITISLEGEVPLDKFSEVMSNFTELLRLLSREIAGRTSIEWVIEDLQAGSATATVSGVSQHAEVVERVVQGYSMIGRSLQYREPIPYPKKIADKALAITSVVNGQITSIRFETAETDYVVSSDQSAETSHSIQYSPGIVAGTVESINRRRGLRFVLYEPIFDRSVTCYVQPGREDQMREIWGRRVVVFGRVGREPERGRPVTVKDITSIQLVPEVEHGSYRTARGILPRGNDDESPEAAIRRVRNAEDQNIL